MIKYEEIRKEVLRAIRSAEAAGLVHGTSGNISVADSERKVAAITPSGMAYEGLCPSDITLIDLDDGMWIDGPYKPSSEVPMHLAIYRARRDVMAVVHTHGMFSTIAAMDGFGELAALTPPHAEFVPVGIAPFAVPGSQEAGEFVTKALGNQGRCALIRNHGMVSCGSNIDSALSAAIYTEEMAEMNYRARLIGVMDPMSEEDVEEVKKILMSGRAV